jgi:FkbM family methyltransferase
MVMSFVYRRVLYSNGVTKWLWNLVRRLIIKIDNEALCAMRVHSKDLIMPLSHSLPLYLHKLPFYDRLPGRLSKYISVKLNSVKCIDVGANIGDTINAFKEPKAFDKHADKDKDVYLAIEPNPRYREYLKLNWGDEQNVVILPYICSSSDGNTAACIKELNGTASVILNSNVEDNQQKFEKMTIDSIVNRHSECGNFNLLIN